MEALPRETRQITPLGKPEEGPLDFGEGEILPLREVLARAQEAFGVRYAADARLSETTYFFNGRWSRKTFDRVLALLTEAKPAVSLPPRQVSHQDQVRDLLTGGASSLLEDDSVVAPLVSNRDFLEGRSMTVEEIAMGKPELLEFFKRRNMDPEMRVTLKAGLLLAIDFGGHTVVGYGGPGRDGKPMPIATSNMARLLIR